MDLRSSWFLADTYRGRSRVINRRLGRGIPFQHFSSNAGPPSSGFLAPLSNSIFVFSRLGPNFTSSRQPRVVSMSDPNQPTSVSNPPDPPSATTEEDALQPKTEQQRSRHCGIRRCCCCFQQQILKDKDFSHSLKNGENTFPAVVSSE